MDDKPKPATPQQKKPYAPPQLVVYGDLAQLTKNVTQIGRADNPPGSMKT